MDESGLIILKSDINAQMLLISRVMALIDERASELTPDNPSRLESVAYQIHNLYNAVEDLLKIVAAYFENQISDTTRWHTALLQRMIQEIPGVRPALLSEECYIILNTLRGFRHFFRHAYGVPIDYAQLTVNLEKARQLSSPLECDIEQFFKTLEQD